MRKISDISPDAKRKIVALTSVFLVIFAVLFLFIKKDKDTEMTDSGGANYDLVLKYMKSEYTDTYAEYFDVFFVEELAEYSEMLSRDGKKLEATFLMKTHYKYPYKDPDTVPNVIEARENGDMEEYKRLYDEYNQVKKADYKLKIEAEIEKTTLTDVKLYSGTEDGEWLPLKDGLNDFVIIEK